MLTCPRCGKQNADDAKFCSECATPLAAPVPARQQRKVVTVLFCDVTGSTELGERLDPEALRTLLARYFEGMKEIVERHGGTVEKFIGDAVMAVFGVPVVHEDDALRALRAATEMADALPALGVQGRIGVATGEVVTGTAERLATGDAVNVAARLQQAAQPGEILFGEDTLRLTRNAVDADPLEPLALKGKAEPVPAYRLVDVRVKATPSRHLDAPMVGRETELRRLGDAFDQAVRDPSCQLFTILGSAGVGKSRLAAEFLGSLDDALVVRGVCLPYGEGITYWPVVEVLKQLPDVAIDPVADERMRALAASEQLVSSSEEIAWAFRKRLEAVAEERPLVCVFDDLHWGEETFLDLVEHVADLSRDAPILLLAMARPELLDRRPGWAGGKVNATSVLLEPLGPGDTDSLIERLADVDPGLRARIRDAAEGNPLYVEEMIALVQESGDGDVVVPPTIHALLAARLDQLDTAERDVLERGAIEGRVFHRGAVQALAPTATEVGARLTALVRKELVRPDKGQLPGEDAFRFRHLLIRDAAYEALPKATRADLHDRFAVWLEEHGTSLAELDEIVGYHLEQAYRYRTELGTVTDETRRQAQRAGEALARAGRRAFDRSDRRAAVNLFQRATALFVDPGPERVGALLELGRCISFVEAGVEGARQVIERAQAEAEALGRDDLAVRAQLEMIHLTQVTQDVDPAEQERLARGAIDMLEARADEEGLARAWFVLATAQWAHARWDDMLEPLQQSIDHARRAGNRSMESDAWTFALVAAIFGSMPVAEGVAMCETLLADAADSRETRAWTLRTIGTLIALEGRTAEGRELIEQARTIFTELGQENGLALIAFSMAPLELLDGDGAAAARELREAIAILDRIGNRSPIANMEAILTDALLTEGLVDEAEKHARRARDLAFATDVSARALWRSATARVLARRGEFEEAIQLASESFDLLDGSQEIMTLTDILVGQAEVLELADRPDEAAAARARAAELLEAKGATAAARRARG